MILLYLATMFLLVVGGAIITVQVLRKPSPFSFLISRGIDPHLWGFHFLGAGSMLSLTLWTLSETTWRELPVPGRLTAIVAFLWVITALLLSLLAVLRSAPEGGSRPILPAPDAKVGTWPGPYRGFLLLGFAALGALAFMAF